MKYLIGLINVTSLVGVLLSLDLLLQLPCPFVKRCGERDLSYPASPVISALQQLDNQTCHSLIRLRRKHSQELPGEEPG